jgi:ATP-dependent helicase/nuclease subunit A
VTDLLSQTQEKPKTSSAPELSATLDFLKKAQRGSDLHRIFEALKYSPYEELKKRLSPAEQELVEYLYSEKTLNFREILERGHNEWGFGLKTPQRMIPGQIDLWAETDHEVHVLDYKTGSSRYAEKAFDQLSFYTLALLEMKQISSDKKIIHSVVYPVEKKSLQKSFANATEFKAKLKKEIQGLFEE